jgi:hypothetical protein
MDSRRLVDGAGASIACGVSGLFGLGTEGLQAPPQEG